MDDDLVDSRSNVTLIHQRLTKTGFGSMSDS